MKKEYRNWVALFIQESYSVLNVRKNRGLNDEQVELIVSSFPKGICVELWLTVLLRYNDPPHFILIRILISILFPIWTSIYHKLLAWVDLVVIGQSNKLSNFCKLHDR